MSGLDLGGHMDIIFVVRHVSEFGHRVRTEFDSLVLAQSYARRMVSCGCSNVSITMEEEFLSMPMSLGGVKVG